MEIIITIILISVALAMDAFAVSITLGMSGLVKNKLNELKIAFIFGLFQGGLFVVGYLILLILGKKITAYNSLFAALLLGFLGVKMLLESFDAKENKCLNEDCINCKKNRCLKTGEYRFLTLKLLLIYATATSIDAFAAGISFGLKYDNIFMAGMFVAIITFLFSYFGVCWGKYLRKYIGNKAELLGGLILIILAIKTLF